MLLFIHSFFFSTFFFAKNNNYLSLPKTKLTTNKYPGSDTNIQVLIQISIPVKNK